MPVFQVAKNSFLNFHSILKYLKNRVHVRVFLRVDMEGFESGTIRMVLLLLSVKASL